MLYCSSKKKVFLEQYISKNNKTKHHEEVFVCAKMLLKETTKDSWYRPGTQKRDYEKIFNDFGVLVFSLKQFFAHQKILKNRNPEKSVFRRGCCQAN